MVKSKEDTIAEFNEQVNMSVEELEEWLENPQSKKAGTGVGLERAAKIIEILKKNPTKDPEKYEDVSTPSTFAACNRTLANCTSRDRKTWSICGRL